MQASKLPKERQKCTLGNDILDYLLNGGIPCGSLTEFVGESASGKTQLCLQLLLTVQLPVQHGGLQGSSLYIYTENYFPLSRLQQLSKYHSFSAIEKRQRDFSRKLKRTSPGSVEKKSNHESDDEDDDEPTTSWGAALDPCRNIFVQGLQTAEELLTYLDRVEALLSHPFRMPVRLLVIDSIAALFRADFDNAAGELMWRSELFFKIASKLKKLAEDYDLAVVVSNQVMDYFETVESARRDPDPLPTPMELGSEILITSGRRIVPALGISWAHCVNTRLFLSRGANPNDNSLRRSMQVVFAPHLANDWRFVLLEENGLCGVPTGREPIGWSLAMVPRRTIASFAYRHFRGHEHGNAKREPSDEHFELELFSSEYVEQEVFYEVVEEEVFSDENVVKGVSSKRKFEDSYSDRPNSEYLVDCTLE